MHFVKNFVFLLVGGDRMLSRNRHSLEVRLALIAVIALFGCVSAQRSGMEATDSGFGGSNTISGTVLAPSGQRMEGHIAVRLSSMMKGSRIAITDDNGNFTFRGLVNGDYTISIDKEKDLEPFSQSVSIIQLPGSPGQNYPLSIRLKIKPGTATKPGVVNAELAGVPENAVAMYRKAAELGNAGDHEGAIAQLNLAIAAFPKFMLAYNDLGVQYMKINGLQKSDEAFIAALKIEPRAYAPLVNRGILLVMTKRYAEAELVLREVIMMKDDQAVGHYFLGQALANQGKFVNAEKELLTAIKLGGDAVKEAHRLLAIIYSSSGDKKGASDELETYLKIAPNAPDAEQLRHVILQLKGLEKPMSTPAKPTQ